LILKTQPSALSTYGAAILSGLLLALAFPKWDLIYLLPLSLLFLFWALRGRSPRQAFWLGWAAGLGFNLLLFYWIIYVCTVYGGLPWLVAAAILTLMAAYLGLYRGLWAWGLAWGVARGRHPVWWGPTLWVVLDFAQASLLFNGFPWAFPGHALYRYPHLLQLADITGVYGLTFLVLFINAALFQVIFPESRRRPQIWCWLLLLILAAVIWMGYGAWRLVQVKELANTSPRLRVAVVQGSIKQGDKWKKEMVQATLDRYAKLTGEVHGAGLVVWPETAAPFFFLRMPDLTAQVEEIAKKNQAHLLFGAPAWELTPQGERFFNRAYLLSPQGEVMGYYDKAHLVPYGEYVPLKRFFPFIRQMVPMVGEFAAGPVGATLTLPEGVIGPLICFESIFPYLSRAQVRQGARLLVNITNDAWYGTTSAPYQHLALGVLRAVENHVCLARAANTGISAFIGPEGRFLWTSGLFVPQAAALDLPLLPGGSFYTHYGDVFAWVCLALTFMGLLRGKTRSRTFTFLAGR